MAFGALDTDADGYVSSGEFERHHAQRMATRAAQGRLLRNAGQAPVFARWDRDRDGQLSRDELSGEQQARWAARQAGWRPCRRLR
jgi:Ca2+-binding EF-hand superfamily protein